MLLEDDVDKEVRERARSRRQWTVIVSKLNRTDASSPLEHDPVHTINRDSSRARLKATQSIGRKSIALYYCRNSMPKAIH